ncbi:MAG: fibrobacter succinogenes major paralogous domain-containing protein [Paludibacteraceae bacterium]|nr:fibrobacter succinogenes major paralogous domain-containing protein [Paludibacteraceae bacterium]
MTYIYLNDTYCSSPEDVKSLFKDQNNLKSKSFRNEVLAYFRDGLLEELYNECGENITLPSNTDTDEKCFKELVKSISGTELTGNISSKFNEIGEFLRVEFEGESYIDSNGIDINTKSETFTAPVKFVFKCLKSENNEYTLTLNGQKVAKNWKSFNRGQEVVYEFNPNIVGEYILFEGGNNSICRISIRNNKLDGHEYVDLGLPSGLKWATCNVGASKPEEYGDYFAWGEVKPKDKYYQNNSLFYDIALYTLKRDEVIDSKGNLTSTYDAASVNWGKNWRMSTKEEFEELIKYCKWTWIALGGVLGYKVESKQTGNNNWIFLPAAGYQDGKSSYNVGNYGYYWSSSVCESNGSLRLYIDSRSKNVNFDFYRTFEYLRSHGLTIRPVTK